MTQLSNLYDGDMRVTNRKHAGDAAKHIFIPHPLHGVEYADGVILCGRACCTPCREYKLNNQVKGQR